MKKKFFFGAKYEIQAVNQERLLSTLSKKIKLFYVKRNSYTQIELHVKPIHKNLFEKELKEKNIKVLKKENIFLFSFFSNFIKKIGVVVGIVVSLALILVFNQFIFQTKIIGLENLEKKEVLNFLNKNDINEFTLKSKIDTKKIEMILSNGFENLSFVSVIIKGNTLVINIKEKISAGDYDNPENLLPLIAKYDGLITNINLISGTLKVKVGQVVKAGDVLVEPYVIDSSNNKKIVKADAEVSARVWLKAKETHLENRLETFRTGSKKVITNLYFLGFKLNSSNLESHFETYETQSTISYIAKNNILPIIREKIVYYETRVESVIESFESVKESVFLKAKQNALQLLEECDIITKEYFTINSNFGVTNVEYVIEVNKLIN